MLQCLKREPGFYRYLWGLTGPIALQNLITFTLGLMDTLMVSWLGNTQMAAVTTANVPVFLLISIVFGVQSGLSILVSQYWGKRDMEHISRAIGVAAMLGTGLTVVLAAGLYLWPVEIMDLLSNNHELSVLGAPYLKLIGISYVFNMLSSLYVSARRSAEDAGFGMKLFAMSTVLNTGLNYLLIFGKCGLPALGIQGAAVATLLARITEFAVCSFCAVRSRLLPIQWRAFFRPGWEMLRRFVKYSSPVILNETAWGLGNSMLTVILGYTDNSVEMLAANAVMGNLNRLFLVVCFGLGAATDNAISVPGFAESSGYPVPKFSHAAAHIRLPLCGAWDRCKEPERDAGSCGCPHHTSSLCPFVPGAQNAGDPKHLLPCSGAGRRICAVTVSVNFSGNAPISTAFGSAIANGVNLRNLQTLSFSVSLLQIHYTI